MIEVEHRRTHRALIDDRDRHHVTRGGERLIGQRAGPLDRRAVDELVDVIECHRSAGGQRGHHRGCPGGFDTQHGGGGGALGQISGDAGDATAATHANDDQIGLVPELVEDLHSDGALAGHGAQIVIRRDQGRTGSGDISECRGRGLVISSADDDQLDEITAVIANPIAFLFRRLSRDVHPAMNLHRAAGQREALSVVSGRRAHHPGLQFVLAELLEQVVGAAHFVGPHALKVLALEIDPGAGDLREPIAVLQRGPQRDIGDPLRSRVDIGRGQRPRYALLAQFGGHRLMVPPQRRNQ